MHAADVTRQQLEETILAVLDDDGPGFRRGGWVPTWSLLGRVERLLRVDDVEGYRNVATSRRFDGRVKRTLEQMATAGRIVKVGARDRLVTRDGSTLGTRGTAHWALPEVAAAIEAAHEQARTDSARRHAAFEERTAKLAAWSEIHGIDEPRFIESSGSVAISLDDYERLLIALEEVRTP